MAATVKRQFLPPLYEQVRLQHVGALREERSARDVRVTELEAQSLEAANASARELASIRADAKHAAEAAKVAAVERLRALELERQHLREQRVARLKTVDEAIEAERCVADTKVQALEEELLAHHAAGDVEIARLAAERDAAVRACDERRSVAKHSCEDKARLAASQECAIAAKSRALLAQEEARRDRSAKEACQRRDEWLRQFEVATHKELQAVSERILDLLQEANVCHDTLEEDRARADYFMDREIETRRLSAYGALEEAHQSLQGWRAHLRHVDAVEVASWSSAVEESHRLNHAYRSKLAAVASTIEDHVAQLPYNVKARRPIHVQGLEQLARDLRAGRFHVPPPRVKPPQPS